MGKGERIIGGMLSVLAAGTLTGDMRPQVQRKNSMPGIYTDCTNSASPRTRFVLPLTEGPFAMRLADRDIIFDTHAGRLSERPQPNHVPTSQITVEVIDGVQTMTVTDITQRGKPTYRVKMNPVGEWEITPSCSDK